MWSLSVTNKTVEQEFSTIISSQRLKLENHPLTRSALWKSESTVKKFQHMVKAKTSENRYTEEGKKNSFTLPVSSFPKGGTAQGQERCPWPTVSPLLGSESIVSEHLAGLLPERPNFSHLTQNTEVISMAEWLKEAYSREER